MPRTPDPELIARARKALTYDLQESNEFIHGVIRDLIKALGGNPTPPRAPKRPRIPPTILTQVMAAQELLSRSPRP